MTNNENLSNTIVEQESSERLSSGTNQTNSRNGFEKSPKHFSAAELWDIQKRKKEIRPRRNSIWS